VKSTALFTGALLTALFLPAPLESALDWTVSLRRAGPIRVGMPLVEVLRVLGDPTARLEGNVPEVPLENCAYLSSKRLPKGLGLMFAKGRVVRIDIYEGLIKTASGAGIGDTEDRILRLYLGRIRVEGHHYDPDGHYLNYSTVDSIDKDYGMVFETDGKKVTSFRTGTVEAIDCACPLG